MVANLFAVQRKLRPIQMCMKHWYSSINTPSAPLLLVKVRNDLKAAMKAKESTRLDVLRSLISDVTNAAKTSKPVTTDAQVLSIIRKRIKSSEGAAAQFKAAKRDDLLVKETAQIDLLEAYVKDSKSLGEAEVTAAIQAVIGNMRSDGLEVTRGSVIKALLGPGGSLEGQPVDKSEVAKLTGGMV